MRLVVDTNILVSFFRPNPVNEIISKSEYFNLDLFSPEYAIKELINNKKEILKYSGLNSKQFENKLSELTSFIRIAPKKLFNKYLKEAKKLIHDKDIPIFALALNLECPIWSNEPGFKKQSQVIIFSTRDMIEILS